MRFTPVISRLARERENLSLKLGKNISDSMFGIDLPVNATLRDFIIKAARTEIPVLLTGETGTGKNVTARAIHDSSNAKGRFVTVDCTTIPHELMESELFGYERGAFTGANAKKHGKVSLADGGTLFLDEIGEIPSGLQSKLLRLLSSGEFEALGSTITRKIRMKLIAATNRDLRNAVAKNQFREDLFFRLNVLKFEIPSLRSNPVFIVPLAEHFLARYAQQLNPEVKSISNDAARIIMKHGWPGNIRELENTIMRALVNCTGTTIGPEDLEIMEMCCPPPEYDVTDKEFLSDDAGFDLKNAREQLDRRYISRALEKTGNNVSKAARLLRISRNSLMELCKKYSLSGRDDIDTQET
jgi:DNA-binding NtrC family response regulator